MHCKCNYFFEAAFRIKCTILIACRLNWKADTDPVIHATELKGPILSAVSDTKFIPKPSESADLVSKHINT